MLKKVWRGIVLIICVTILFSVTGLSVYAAKGDKKPEDNSTTKKLLVKYKKDDSKREDKLKENNKKQKVKKYKRLNNKNLYSIEVDDAGLETLLEDIEIEIVEEDTVIQLLSGIVKEDNESSENTSDDSQKRCIICGELSCDSQQECIDITHEICNNCIFELFADIPIEQAMDHECSDEIITESGCDCGCSDEDQDDEIVCEIDDCNTDCTCPNEESFTIVEPVAKSLETGTNSVYTVQGDEQTWNFLRTKANLLHDNNILGNGIKVAVFDTGIDLNQSDLVVTGGVSFVDGIDNYTDDNGHGTAMASILAAQLNGNGFVGISPNVELYSVKVLDKDGFGRYSSIIQGIEWAIQNNIDIISLSLGGIQYSQILEESINLAVENNILIIAAAGNGGIENIMYPAAYPQVVCVGATDGDNNISSFSNYGFQLDIVAPGENVVTTGWNNSIITVNGTSPATQHVAGVAALLWSADRSLTNGHIKYLLYKNGYELGEYNTYGHGLLDAESAYHNLMQGNYTIYIDDGENGSFVEGLVDVGWDGVVYGQLCNHTMVVQTNNAATCTKDGLYVEVCSKCGFTYSTTIPKLGHNNKTTTKPATCTSDGYQETKCTRCGYISAHSTITKLGHDIRATTYPPTCTEAGRTIITCGRCSYTETKILPPMGHWEGPPETVEATCISDGYTSIHCIRCGCEVSRTTIPMRDHTWVQGVPVNATCTEQGYTPYSCSCGASRIDGVNGPLGHNWVLVIIDSPTCTSEGAYVYACSNCGAPKVDPIPKTGHDYSGYYVSPTHSSSGHYWETYCVNCGSTSSSGYTTLSTCLSCTTAPSVSFTNISGSTVLSEADTSFIPQIKVFDNENDTLTCKYYLDGSTTAVGTITVTGTKPEKTVLFSNSFSTANLAEGNHTIKATVKDSVAPMGEASITFKVDKSAPVISTHTVTPSTNDVKITVTATDSISELASAAYRYTIAGTATGWLASNNYTKAGLVPNTGYSYIVEVRDIKGHITTKTGNFNTKVELPAVTVTPLHEEGLQIVVKDNNPSYTQYRVKVGSGYMNASGVIIGSESWITIPYDAAVSGKKIVLSGLLPNTSYSVTVSARNSTATETVISTSVSAITSPAAPADITVTSLTHEQVSLVWSSVTGAVSYEIYRETVNNLGVVTSSHAKTITTNYCYDDDVLPEQTYRYKIRSINQAGIHGKWSSPMIEVTTLPDLPEKVTGVIGTANGTQLELSWDAITGAVGYMVELSFDGTVVNTYVITNEISFDTEVFNCQCSIIVKAFNKCSEADPEDPAGWTNVGEWSDSLILYTPADTPAMNPILAEQITPNSITVSWNVKQNPASVSYRLCITQGDNVVSDSAVVGATITDNMITYQVTGLLPETLYDFQVKAINSIGVETEWSNEVNAATPMDYPDIPGRLRATAKADRISLSWDAAVNAQSYQLEKDGILLVANWPGVNYIDTDVQPDMEYTYRVKAVNTTGESYWSQSLLKKTLGNVPVSPTISVVTGSSISVTIEWSSAEDVSGYELEADGQIYNMGLGTTFEHNGLVPGTMHIYAVRSRNVYGRSEWSNFVTYKTRSLVPDIPVITQVMSSENLISLLWDAVEGTGYYEVEIDGTVVGNISALGYQYEFYGEDIAGTEHVVRIRAVNESGAGSWTAPYPVTLPEDGEGGAPVIPIPSPPNPVCSATGSAIIYIGWDVIPDATYYQLEADNTIVYTGSDTRYIHTGLEPDSLHQYRVLAGNLSGQSSWSAVVTAVTETQYSTTPQNISYYRVDDGTTMIIWDQAADITNYIVEINSVSGSAITVTGISATITTAPGELYNIRIASVVEKDGAQYLDWSEEITFRTPRKLPGIPENIVVEATSDTITVTWTDVPEAQGYELAAVSSIFDLGSNTTYVLTGLSPSHSYSIYIRAYNEAGAGEWSEEVSIMTNEELPGIPVNIFGEPYQPTGSTRGSAVRLQWDAVRRAVSYDIEASNGIIYSTNTNEIIIEGLEAGITYLLRVRANSRTSSGAWSSWIFISPVIVKPDNVAADIVEDKIRVSWNPVSVDDSYEIEIDGVKVQATEGVSHYFDYQLFYLQRIIRIRALRESMTGYWSEPLEFAQPLPVDTTVYEGETFSVLLPAVNVELGSYKLTLTYSTEEVELVDACELTAEAELASSFIEEFNTHIIIENDGISESITLIIEDGSGISFTGLVNSIRLRSKVTGNITLYYGVTLR